MLSILTVSQGKPFAFPFLDFFRESAAALKAELVVVADGAQAAGAMREHGIPVARTVSSKGYIESVLDAAVETCSREYILRLDDDETFSWPMFRWLESAEFVTHDHWKFPRAHLWGNPETFIMHPQLWPDHQTRLSVRAKSGGRTTVHAGSPHGGGEVAPVVIKHHKFLIKTREEREAIAAGYDRVHPGYGTGGMLAFSLPEDAITAMDLRPLTEAFELAGAV